MIADTVKCSQNQSGSLYYVLQNPVEQYSSDAGWDNPFRPGGDLSREADQIVNLIKDGKPITPTENLDQERFPASTNKVFCKKYKTNAELEAYKCQPPNKSKNSCQAFSTLQAVNACGKIDSHFVPHVFNKTEPVPNSACRVVIEEKKNNRSCCSIQ